LAFAHAAGVIHRDLKPSNVIVTRDGAPVLVDFGVAFESDSDAPGLTRTGEFAGTPAYLAPELIAGERARADERCDVYALGVTLYECLTLRQPFAAPTRDSLYRAVLAGESLDVRSLNGDVPRDLAVIVATAIERDPRRRYASAEAFADDLAAFLSGRDIAARAAGPLERLTRWARREPRQAVLAAALAVVAVAGSVAAGMWLSAQQDARVGRQAQQAREIEAALVEAYATLSSSKLDAAAGFERVLALDPHNVEASVGRILACLRARRDEQARELLRDAPASPAFDRLRAIAERRVSSVEDSSWLERASAFELFVDAEALRFEGERRPRSEQPTWWRAALERIEAAIDRSPRPRATHHHLRVFCASKAGDAAATRSASQAILALWPDSALSLFQAGSSLASLDPRKAIELLTRSAELDGARAATFQCLGIARLQLGEFDGALAPLRRALELDPLDVLAHNGLGAVYQRMGCEDQARGKFLEVLSIDPWSIDAWANLTLVSRDMNEALAAAEHVIELDPGQAGHRAVLGAALLNLGEHTRGRDEFAVLVAAHGENPMYWYTYSGALAQSGELQTAWDALQLAKGLEADLPGLELFEEQLRAALQAGQ
jgi:tetratricopeptide (TPR) repeat protein